MHRPTLLVTLVIALGACVWWFGGPWSSDRAAGAGAPDPNAAPSVAASPGAADLLGSGADGPRASVPESSPSLDDGYAWPAVVTGRVRDSYGDPRLHHIIAFVPNGERAPTRPQEWLALPHARSDRAGEFVARLPGPGRYRVFVGYSGRVLLEDTRVVELGPGGPNQLEIVIPAPTRLLIEVHEPPGLAPTPPYGVSVYRESAALDLERPLPPQVTTDALPDLDDPTLDEETRAELRMAIEHQSRVLTADERAALERRQRVVPTGWRMDRSAVCDVEGRLLLEFLPLGEELRFAASRGGEAFRIEGSAWLGPAAPTRVRIDLPPPLAAEETLGAEPREARATVTPVELRREPLEIGVTWTP